MSADYCSSFRGIRLEHPILNGSGTFETPSRRAGAFCDAADERLPLQRIRLEDDHTRTSGRNGQRACTRLAGVINLIGLPNKGSRAF